MGQRSKVPYYESPSFVQYSKKMCTCVVVFWMVYRVINFLMILIRADISTTLVDLVGGVDTVMICNMGFYVGKSGFENVAKILAGRRVLSKYKNEDSDENDEEEEINDEDQLES